jgi:hypothetical protein
MAPIIKLRNGASEKVTELTAKLWVLLGGQRPTYEQTIDIICGNVDDADLNKMVDRYRAQHNELSG